MVHSLASSWILSHFCLAFEQCLQLQQEANKGRQKSPKNLLQIVKQNGVQQCVLADTEL
jgi:hypothetical protein